MRQPSRGGTGSQPASECSTSSPGWPSVARMVRLPQSACAPAPSEPASTSTKSSAGKYLSCLVTWNGWRASSSRSASPRPTAAKRSWLRRWFSRLRAAVYARSTPSYLGSASSGGQWSVAPASGSSAERTKLGSKTPLLVSMNPSLVSRARPSASKAWPPDPRYPMSSVPLNGMAALTAAGCSKSSRDCSNCRSMSSCGMP
mmetsp:Transcript_30101/g.100628  ORF Transcript_30101/g.100628 Transcript_30101/m.100628 type:complete len:201 (-) Transcript_30101:221-823(-)